MSRKIRRNREEFDDITNDDFFEKRRKVNPPNSLKLKSITPLTDNQQKVFDSYYSGKNQLLMGCAGTGKTFLSLYLLLKDLLAKDSEFEQLIIIRSAVQTRDQGFLPGNLKEKMKVYEAPYSAICSELFGRGDAYEILKNKQQIKFESTSFLRGMTYNNSLILVDEFQNMDFKEASTVLSRVGINSKIIFSGDYIQTDLRAKFKDDDTSSQILKFISVLNEMKFFDIINFNIEDIQRSDLVKEFLKICYKRNIY